MRQVQRSLDGFATRQALTRCRARSAPQRSRGAKSGAAYLICSLPPHAPDSRHEAHGMDGQVVATWMDGEGAVHWAGAA